MAYESTKRELLRTLLGSVATAEAALAIADFVESADAQDRFYLHPPLPFTQIRTYQAQAEFRVRFDLDKDGDPWEDGTLNLLRSNCPSRVEVLALWALKPGSDVVRSDDQPESPGPTDLRNLRD